MGTSRAVRMSGRIAGNPSGSLAARRPRPTVPVGTCEVASRYSAVCFLAMKIPLFVEKKK